MEFRGHDNTVEVVVFAPINAYPAIRELMGLPVCLDSGRCSSFFDALDYLPRRMSVLRNQVRSSSRELGINISSCGTSKVAS